MSKEIERRFEIEKVPEGNIDRITIIEQQYLVTSNDEETGEEMRIRKSITGVLVSHTLTMKTGKGLVREENETNINSNTYEQLKSLSPHKPVEKVRMEMKLGNNVVVIDRFFHDSNLIIAEVEFSSEEKAKNFVPPSWFIKEVTRKSEYSNSNIWKSLNKIGGTTDEN